MVGLSDCRWTCVYTLLCSVAVCCRCVLQCVCTVCCRCVLQCVYNVCCRCVLQCVYRVLQYTLVFALYAYVCVGVASGGFERSQVDLCCVCGWVGVYVGEGVSFPRMCIYV